MTKNQRTGNPKTAQVKNLLPAQLKTFGRSHPDEAHVGGTFGKIMDSQQLGGTTLATSVPLKLSKTSET